MEGANALRKRTIPAQDVYKNKNLKDANGPGRGVADSSLVCCTYCGHLVGGERGASVCVQGGGAEGSGLPQSLLLVEFGVSTCL